jgi:hypothetical protein
VQKNVKMQQLTFLFLLSNGTYIFFSHRFISVISSFVDEMRTDADEQREMLSVLKHLTES